MSALMDGECTELELRRLLKMSDDDLAQRWRRYHLARSVIQHDRNIDTSVDLSAGIMASIKALDETQGSPSGSTTDSLNHNATRQRSLTMLLRGVGIAAAVSLMIVTGVQYIESTGQPGVQQAAGIQPADVQTATGPTTPDNSAASSLSAPVSTRADLEPFSSADARRPGQAPVFESTPFKLKVQSPDSGLMQAGIPSFTLGQAGNSRSGRPLTANPDTLQQLQSYLEQHAQSTASIGSDSWTPLTRSLVPVADK